MEERPPEVPTNPSVPVVLNLGSPPPSQGVLRPLESQALTALTRSSQELVDLKSVYTSGHLVAPCSSPRG